MSAPLPANESERLTALHRMGILDTPQEAVFDRICRLTARLYGVPIVQISLVDEERQWFKSCLGVDAHETSRENSFCAHALLREDVLVVLDACADARFQQNPLVTGAPGIRFYAGAQIRTPDGYKLGTLCIIDTAPRMAFGADDRAALRDLAEMVSEEFVQRRMAGQLREGAELLELAQDAAFMCDLDRRITGWSDCAEETYGWRREEALGQKADVLLQTRYPQSVEAVDAELHRTGFWEGDMHHVRRDGATIFTANRQVLRRDASGQPMAILDLTARRRTEAALRRAKEEAEQANRAKSTFLSRMSHELRTPLNAILGFGHLLSLSALDERQRESTDHILKSGHHLLDLINKVLDLSHLEAGRLELSLQTVLLPEVFAEMLALVRPLASQNSVHLICIEAAESSTQWRVLADRQRLQQVLLNLLHNAIKYNHNAGKVFLTCSPVELAGDGEENGGTVPGLHVSVRDNGPGIAPEHLRRLFVPFDRSVIDSTRTGGTGLGLVLSKRLVEAMGGRMGATSTLGEGSDFWFDLPAAAAEPTPLPAAKMNGTSDSPASRSSEPSSVLYIDDDVSNLELIAQLLKSRPQVQLLSALQSRLGLELARQHRPKIILLDLHLPDISGLELIGLLRAEEILQGVPIIIVSADASPAQIARVTAAGANRYLTKPLDLRELMRIIDDALKENAEAKIAYAI